MRQSVRAIGWAITISMLLLLAFLLTAVYSAFQTLMVGQGIAVGGFQTSFSDDSLVLSVPVTVNNTGYYDMTDFEVATKMKLQDGRTLTEARTKIRQIRKGQAESALHNLSLSLEDILSNMTELLFNDAEFKIDLSMGFRYAYALGFQLALSNMSVPWGAPLYSLSIREVSPDFNGTYLLLRVTLEVENHSFFDVSGSLDFRIYNEKDAYIGSGRGEISIPSGSRFSGAVDLTTRMANPLDFTGKGYVEGYLDVPMLSQTLEMGRIEYG